MGGNDSIRRQGAQQNANLAVILERVAKGLGEIELVAILASHALYPNVTLCLEVTQYTNDGAFSNADPTGHFPHCQLRVLSKKHDDMAVVTEESPSGY